MPRHNFEPLAGRIDTFSLAFPQLEGNLLRDPYVRQVCVYIPPGYDTTAQRYPLLVDLAAFGSSGLRRISWTAFGESVPQRLERLVQSKRMGEMVVAFVDGFSSLGGNQYVNTPVMGRWEDALVHTLVPALHARYRLLGPQHRAAFGKSSGGYGALLQGLRHAEHWGAVACLSGDMDFELAYARDFPALLTALAPHSYQPAAFVQSLWSEVTFPSSAFGPLMSLAMAASYDPNIDAPLGLQLPVHHETCARLPERWDRWRAWDPLILVQTQACQDALGSLRAVYMDCGTRDEYGLQYGANRLSASLHASGIAHTYERFEGTHRNTDARLDRALPWLYEAIA